MKFNNNELLLPKSQILNSESKLVLIKCCADVKQTLQEDVSKVLLKGEKAFKEVILSLCPNKILGCSKVL